MAQVVPHKATPDPKYKLRPFVSGSIVTLTISN